MSDIVWALLATALVGISLIAIGISAYFELDDIVKMWDEREEDKENE